MVGFQVTTNGRFWVTAEVGDMASAKTGNNTLGGLHDAIEVERCMA